MVDQKPQSRRSIIRWVLAASLGLNLLFIGAFAGAAFRGAGPGGGGDDQRTALRGYAAPYVHALPRETRRALAQEMRKDRKGQASSSKRARRAQYQEMVTVLRQIPFDPAAAEQILDTQRDAVTTMQSAAQILWLKEVTEMAPDARAAYANQLEKVLKRRPIKRKRGPETGE